jgi:hypothetical protein
VIGGEEFQWTNEGLAPKATVRKTRVADFDRSVIREWIAGDLADDPIR